ncbi:MAG TPA: TnpV protein, partial [Ruminococcus bromii]|nr:TnpV protein [Ruminococcus bromii]
ERLTDEMAKREGLTEQLKAEDMIAWVRRMNNIYARAREIVNTEGIYI